MPNQTQPEVIFEQLRQAYQKKWEGDNNYKAITAVLDEYRNESGFQEVLRLFKEYLEYDETPCAHRFRREKITLFMGSIVYVKTTAEFTGLIQLIDSYQAPKAVNSTLQNLVSIFSYINLLPIAVKIQLALSIVTSAVVAAAGQNTANEGADLRVLTSADLFPTDHFGMWSVTHNIKQDTLRGFIDQRTVIDPYLQGKVKKDIEKKCEDVKNKIVETTKTLPDTASYIIPTLRRNGFRVLCTSGENLDKYTGSSSIYKGFGETLGRFIPENKALLFAADRSNSTDPSLVNHEFIHVRHFFLHQTEQCKTKEYDLAKLATPVYPVNAKNIAEYNKALDEGDKRIEKFAELRIKKREDKLTDKNEKKLYEKYMTASAGCTLTPFVNEISPSVYEQLIKLDAKNYPTLNVGNGEQVKVIKIQKFTVDKQDKYMALLQPTEPAQAVILTPSTVKTNLAGPKYLNNPDFSKLAEREAYTFQGFTEEAIKTFYESAYALRQKYIKRCADPNDNQQVKLSNRP